ncbi:hypothetical protein [Bifidobacterium platyrrhinorum]|uniref:Uncharacterized protein n=1 Tax=Bifidobacterium platyrrhinorum TaxID=2661628 RepID=A0A6L9SUD4_9BIFI|nr:hypothetical protein [Bifidobacterium platyrrhinorum]NEG55443.1 hypothetical protein [Bifidobacterium platyrrhinorum]
MSRKNRELGGMTYVAWKVWRLTPPRIDYSRSAIARDEYDSFTDWVAKQDDPVAAICAHAPSCPDIADDELGTFRDWVKTVLFPGGRLDKTLVWECCEDGVDDNGDPVPVPES